MKMGFLIHVMWWQSTQLLHQWQTSKWSLGLVPKTAQTDGQHSMQPALSHKRPWAVIVGRVPRHAGNIVNLQLQPHFTRVPSLKYQMQLYGPKLHSHVSVNCCPNTGNIWRRPLEEQKFWLGLKGGKFWFENGLEELGGPGHFTSQRRIENLGARGRC